MSISYKLFAIIIKIKPSKIKKVSKFDVEKRIQHIIMNLNNEYNIIILNTQILQKKMKTKVEKGHQSSGEKVWISKIQWHRSWYIGYTDSVPTFPQNVPLIYHAVKNLF